MNPSRDAESAPSRIPPTDQVYAALRIAVITVGITYVYLAPDLPGSRTELLTAFAFFAGYSVIVSTAGWARLRSFSKGRIYATLAVVDLIFVLLLMHLTGGGTSPFYRAMYLWVAVVAFYFGQRGGVVSSIAAFVAFLWFFAQDDDVWTLGVKLGGLLLHGPVIGMLIERERRHARDLSTARREIARLGNERGPKEASVESVAQGEVVSSTS